MKKTILLAVVCFCSLQTVIAQNKIYGAWKQQQGSAEAILIIQRGYFSITNFDIVNKKFINTLGGRYDQSGNSLSATIEFNSSDKAQVGNKMSFDAVAKDNSLTTNITPTNKEWKMIDNNEAVLAGVWVITGREQNGVMNKLTPGERKTIKILTGTRFQWAAINTATGDFFGTGGGQYTLQNDIYTEQIQFFSRDSSRVGKSLSFNASVDGDEWRHRGKSSRGEPVYEIWTRLP